MFQISGGMDKTSRGKKSNFEGMLLLRAGEEVVIFPSVLLVAFGVGGTMLVMVFHLREALEATPSQVGSISAVWSLSYILGCIFMRPVFQRVVPRSLMLISTSCMFLFLSCILFVKALWIAYMLYSLYGFAESFLLAVHDGVAFKRGRRAFTWEKDVHLQSLLKHGNDYRSARCRVPEYNRNGVSACHGMLNLPPHEHFDSRRGDYYSQDQGRCDSRGSPNRGRESERQTGEQHYCKLRNKDDVYVADVRVRRTGYQQRAQNAEEGVGIVFFECCFHIKPFFGAQVHGFHGCERTGSIRRAVVPVC